MSVADDQPTDGTDPTGPDDAAAAASGAEAVIRYQRDDVEFSRATSFFDSTYAVAATLLVTTLDPGQGGWSSWSKLNETVGDQFTAFAISFAVVAAYWWMNHRLIASLTAISPRLVVSVVFSLAFVVLLPFTTDGLAEGSTVPTVAYAVNVALVSLTGTLAYAVAWSDGLFREHQDRDVFRRHLAGGLITPAVFLLSIPIAIGVNATVAKWSWLLLLPLGVMDGRAEGRWLVARASRSAGAVSSPPRE